MQRWVVVAVVAAAAIAVVLFVDADEENASSFRPLIPEMALALAALSSSSAPAPAPPLEEVGACDLVIPPEQTTIEGGQDGPQPGDVICLEGGSRPPLRMIGLRGEHDRPIVVVNSGTVEIVGTHDDYAGILIAESSDLRITGSGAGSACGVGHPVDQQQCGIVIRGTGRGIAAGERTTRLTIDHVEVTGTSHSAVTARAKIEDGVTRESFTQEQTRVQSTYLHGIGKEGLYLGSSSYAEGEDPLLEGVVVTHNLIVDTGWDGIQVGSAVADCGIHWNKVVLAGSSNASSQNSGIIANRGSRCDITHNVVVSAAANGIYVQGNGGHTVADNLVVGSGARDRRGSGIAVRTGSNEGMSITVLHNAVVAPAAAGIVYRNEVGADNVVANNLVAGAGGVPIDIGDDVEVRTGGNVVTDTVELAGFAGPATGDFRPMASSPAVDAAVQVAGYEPATDLLGLDVTDVRRRNAGAIESTGGPS